MKIWPLERLTNIVLSVLCSLRAESVTVVVLAVCLIIVLVSTIAILLVWTCYRNDCSCHRLACCCRSSLSSENVQEFNSLQELLLSLERDQVGRVIERDNEGEPIEASLDSIFPQILHTVIDTERSRSLIDTDDESINEQANIRV